MKTISIDQLKQWKTEQKDFLLINVLDPEAFGREHALASKNVPLSRDDFEATVMRMAGTKDRPVVVYCASTDCDASAKAAKRLDAAGFKNVYDFEGGLKAWKADGQPVGSTAKAGVGR